MRVLHVDVTTGEVRKEDLPEEARELWLGGAGLGAWLVYDQVPTEADPMGPDNVLVFTPGLVNGAPFVTPGKCTFSAKSPLTGTMGDATMGGRIGAAARHAGYDAIVIRGRSVKPVTVVVDDEEVTLRPSSDLWGLDARQASEDLRRELGHEFAVATIGVGGENMVKYACIDCDDRQSGRGGMGAVMGSKLVKALAVRGTGRLPVAHPEELPELLESNHQTVMDDKTKEGMRKHGTGGFTNWVNKERGTFPTKNWQQSVYDDRDRIVPQHWAPIYGVRSKACYGCMRPCGKLVKVEEGPYEGTVVDGVEYETIYSLGGVICNPDPELLAHLNELCDVYGLDTISAGVVIAWAMEAAERGLLTEFDLGGLDVGFHNPGCAPELLRRIAHREGIGDLLAEGVAKAAAIVGQGSEEFAIHVKGMEPPAYDVRGLKTLALGFAVSPRGACHLKSGGYLVDLMGSFGPFEDVDRFSAEGRGEMVMYLEDLFVAYDCLGVCKFSRKLYEPEDLADTVRLMTGKELSVEEMFRLGERVTSVRRLFNCREGFTRADDTLPWRVLNEPVKEGPSKGHMVSPEELQAMLDDYYSVRGWDADGRPTEAKLEELGIAGQKYW
ncbi:MAG: aldehyde ferredoxin oxidoreductase family protein [Thermoplasmata archaeon]|nr:MAG: aldehyde ferredoxin oxidoreductase family protein [Thermoplasmata archaeon]